MRDETGGATNGKALKMGLKVSISYCEQLLRSASNMVALSISYLLSHIALFSDIFVIVTAKSGVKVQR